MNHLLKELRPQFTCSYCEKTFTLKSNLNFHEKTVHLRIAKEFKCHCGFTSSVSLYMHNRTMHKESMKTFPCSKCDKTFGSKGQLKDHNRRHHDPKQPCEVCGKLVKSMMFCILFSAIFLFSVFRCSRWHQDIIT